MAPERWSPLAGPEAPIAPELVSCPHPHHEVMRLKLPVLATWVTPTHIQAADCCPEAIARFRVTIAASLWQG